MHSTHAARHVRLTRSWIRRLPLLVTLVVSSACFPAPGTPAGERIVHESLWVQGGQATTAGADSPWRGSPAARETNLTGDGSQLLVEARLNGRVSGVFLLDTGASYCVITPRTARRLGIGRPKTGDDPVILATPTGEIEAPMTRLHTIEVANMRAGDVSTVIYPAVEEPLSGILGLSFLSQFEFSVDARRRVLRLRPF